MSQKGVESDTIQRGRSSLEENVTIYRSDPSELLVENIKNSPLTLLVLTTSIVLKTTDPSLQRERVLSVKVLKRQPCKLEVICGLEGQVFDVHVR